MKTFKEKEIKIKKIAKMIPYSVEFLPGKTPELDSFLAKNEALDVFSYGKTEKEALEGAQIQAISFLMEN